VNLPPDSVYFNWRSRLARGHISLLWDICMAQILRWIIGLTFGMNAMILMATVMVQLCLAAMEVGDMKHQLLTYCPRH
jgi:hypothetical protein